MECHQNRGSRGTKLVTPRRNKGGYMGQTVVGFFRDAADVQQAIQRLETNGISNQQVDVSKGKHTDGATDTDRRKTNKITEFFNRLFGHESDDARLYSTIGQNDVHIVTVHATSGSMAETAADVLDNCGAIDVDDYRNEYSSGHQQQATQHNYTDHEDQSTTRRDDVAKSHHSFDSMEGRDKSLAARDDYANSLSSESLSAQLSDPTNIRDDEASDRGPGMSNVNSEYVDERSYPGDRFGPTNDTRDDLDTNASMRNPIEESGRSNSSFGYVDNSQNQHTGNRTEGSRGSFTGEDMTNDGISLPGDDQRVIDQDNPLHERSNMISDEQAPGLENLIPTPLEQLNRAKRRSRIVNASVDEHGRLRE